MTNKGMGLTFDELQKLVTSYVYGLYMDYDLPEREVATIMDTMKMFAGEYHYLVQAGKVPKNMQYQHDFKKGMEAINEQLKDMGQEL